ncbi:MAG: hypothetical protein GY829_07750 [Gammaproteobacteria bacterium]|nr:hypothetical protein [Gammaproteobacteria bacterium]
MNRLLVSTALIAILPLTFVSASEPLAEDLSKCATITRDLQRLACYDRLASGKSPSGQVVLMDKKTARAVTHQKTTAVNAEPTNTFGLKNSAAPPSSSSFGLKEATDSSEVLHSLISGEFTGWKKGDKIKLANGQVWKIVGSKTLYHKASNPNISISRGMFNSFRISVDGLNRSTRVVRIK